MTPPRVKKIRFPAFSSILPLSPQNQSSYTHKNVPAGAPAIEAKFSAVNTLSIISYVIRPYHHLW